MCAIRAEQNEITCWKKFTREEAVEMGRAGLPHLTFHWLGYTSASLLPAGGANVVTVSERLGHASLAWMFHLHTLDQGPPGGPGGPVERYPRPTRDEGVNGG